MEKKEKDFGNTCNYLCKNRRYKLSWILRINNEKIIFRTPHIFRDILLFTETYIYKFEREQDDTDKDAAIFKERELLSKESLDSIKKRMESQEQYFGYDYKFFEGLDLPLGDYPRFEERIRRIKKRKEFDDSLRKNENQ